MNPSSSGKYFFLTEADMRKFKADNAGCDLTTCTSVEVPAQWLDFGTRRTAFGEGPQIHFEDSIMLEMYDGMCLPKILDHDNILDLEILK